MKTALLVLLGVVTGVAGSEGLRWWASSIEAGKERRFGADIRAAMHQLEDYRREHTTYPVACDRKSLSGLLGPRNIIGEFEDAEFQYCSDGQQYLLAFVPFGTRSYHTAYGAPLLASNNELIAAPVAARPGSQEATGTQ